MFTCTVKSCYSCSLTRPFNWVAVLVPIHKRWGRIDLLTNVFSIQLPWWQYARFSLLVSHVFQVELLHHRPSWGETQTALHLCVACSATQSKLHLLLSAKMRGSRSSTRHVVSFVLFWLFLDPSPHTECLETVSVWLRCIHPGASQPQLRYLGLLRLKTYILNIITFTALILPACLFSDLLWAWTHQPSTDFRLFFAASQLTFSSFQISSQLFYCSCFSLWLAEITS